MENIFLEKTSPSRLDPLCRTQNNIPRTKLSYPDKALLAQHLTTNKNLWLVESSDKNPEKKMNSEYCNGHFKNHVVKSTRTVVVVVVVVFRCLIQCFKHKKGNASFRWPIVCSVRSRGRFKPLRSRSHSWSSGNSQWDKEQVKSVH